MTSVRRHRNRVLDRDGDALTEHYTRNLDGTWHFVFAEELPNRVGFEDCLDWNNRASDTATLVSSGDLSYVSGYGLDLRGHVCFPVPVSLDSGITTRIGPHGTLFGDGRMIEGSLTFSRNFCRDVPFDVFIDEDGKYNDPYFGDFEWILIQDKYRDRARLDLRPDRPAFNLLREAGELKDLPGQFRELKDTVENFKSFHGNAKSYLAVQFGWLPLVSSIRSYIDLYNTMEKRIRQLLKDDGKRVKRKRDYVTHASTKTSITKSYVWPDTGSTWQSLFDYPLIGHISGEPDIPWSVTTTVTQSHRIWASGVYLYHLPPGPKNLAYLQKLLRNLANFRLTVGQVYDLVPWTWLLDWFTNVGNIVHSMDPGVGMDGAFQNFFLMGEKLTTVEVEATFQAMDINTKAPVTYTLSCRHEFKHKLRDSLGGPFDIVDSGFEMTPFQLSILGAIGISKFPKVARSL